MFFLVVSVRFLVDRCPHSEKMKQSKYDNTATFSNFAEKSLPLMWGLAEHLNWSVLLLIMVDPLAENRWCMRKQCCPLEDAVSFSVGLRGYIFLWGYQLNMDCKQRFCFKSKKNSSIPSKENHVSSRALYCSHCFPDASPHQASGTWQPIRLKNRKGMGEVLMHEESNEECQSHACCRFHNDINSIISVSN